MKTLKLALLLTAFVTINASAYQVGTGSSSEVSTLTGTVTQTGSTAENHQGVTTTNVSGINQVDNYQTSATGTSSFKGNLVDTTTTNDSFSFFNN